MCNVLSWQDSNPIHPTTRLLHARPQSNMVKLGRLVWRLLPALYRVGRLRTLTRRRTKVLTWAPTTHLSYRRVRTQLQNYWGGPLWRDRFLLGFLDPKLVSRKIIFFHLLKEQKVWKTYVI